MTDPILKRFLERIGEASAEALAAYEVAEADNFNEDFSIQPEPDPRPDPVESPEIEPFRTAQDHPHLIHLEGVEEGDESVYALSHRDLIQGLTVHRTPLRNIYSMMTPVDLAGHSLLGRDTAGQYVRMDVDDVSRNTDEFKILSERYPVWDYSGFIRSAPDSRLWEQSARTGHYLRFSGSDDRRLELVPRSSVYVKLVVDLPGSFDWAAPLPSGRGVVVQYKADGAGLGEGLWVYYISGRQVQVWPHHHHADLGMSAGGVDCLYTYENRSSEDNNLPAIYQYTLDEMGVGQNQYSPPIPWGRHSHFSAKGPDGWVLVSTNKRNPENALCGQLYAVGPERRLVPLCFHYSSYDGTPYWQTPMASWGRSVDLNGNAKVHMLWGSTVSDSPLVGRYVVFDERRLTQTNK